MSTKKTILDNLETALRAIKKSGGYNTDIADVKQFGLAMDVQIENKPAVAIVEMPERAVAEDDTNIQFVMPISLVAIMTDRSGLRDKITLFVDDIKKVVCAASLGDNCLDINLTGLGDMAYTSTEGDARVPIMVDIRYYAAKAGF